MPRHANAIASVASGSLMLACPTNDVPENEPTLVTVTSDDDGGAPSDAGDEGLDDTGPPAPQCWPDHQPQDPALFQCFGLGMGDLQWEQYVLSWSPASLDEPVEIEFPPPEDGGPNVRACCEAEAEALQVRAGCLEDCARAACNLAIDRLRGRLAASPPCHGECKERFAETLTTWIDFLTANYDACLQVARGQASALNLPDPPRASDAVPTGAGRAAVLSIACAVDQAELPYDTDQTCETGHNEPAPVAWEEWSCPVLDGGIEITGPDGTSWAPLQGSATFRRGLCATGPCWFSLESLALAAPGLSLQGTPVGDAMASLAYPGFGRYDATTPDGTIAPLMLGLDVVLGTAPSPSSGSTVSFPIANHDPALFEIGSATFQILDATFAWDDLAATLTTAPASCVCASCP